MNRVVLLVLALCVPLLSGCATFGYPPDAVRPGTAPLILLRDASGQECVMGPPFSPVPPGVAAAVGGRRVGESFEVDASTCNELVVSSGIFGRWPRHDALPTRVFERVASGPAVVGANVTITSGRNLLLGRVTSVNASTVGVELLPWPTEHDATHGVDFVWDLTDTELVGWARANSTGQVFGAVLTLPPGNYTLVESRGHDLVFAADREVHLKDGPATARIVRVVPMPVAPQEGYGARRPLDAPLAPPH
jgi:hypothetical protein